MVNITVKVSDNGLANAFEKKASDLNSKFTTFTKDLVDIAHRWVQNQAPRKTGKLKASIRKQNTSNGGYVFISACNYADYVIEGTQAHTITPKHKKALRVPGYGVFKSVNHPGTKSNPFFDKAASAMMSEINSRVAAFEEWLGSV